MDDFDEALRAISDAKAENRNAILSKKSARILLARQQYLDALERYSNVYQKHIETVRVKKWMASYEASKSRGTTQEPLD